jgi:hypothetical protein
VTAAVLETSAEQRRHVRDEALARGLVTTLEQQAREIVEFAAATEGDDTVHSFARYQEFRRKVGEFESLCTVIETNLRKVAAEPRGVLNELFHTRRDMVLGPSIRAMTAFFARLSESGTLPLGLFDILDSELSALDGMREALTAADPPARDEAGIRAEIDRLEAIIKGIQARSSQFLDFSNPDAVAEILPPEEIKPEADEVPDEEMEDAQANGPDTRELRAVRNIRDILDPLRKDFALGQHAEIDVRALADIERRLTKNADDEGAAKWLRHLCSSWSSRLRAKEHVFLRILDEIR